MRDGNAIRLRLPPTNTACCFRKKVTVDYVKSGCPILTYVSYLEDTISEVEFGYHNNLSYLSYVQVTIDKVEFSYDNLSHCGLVICELS